MPAVEVVECHVQYREASRQLANARERTAHAEALWHQAKADEHAAAQRVADASRALASARRTGESYASA